MSEYVHPFESNQQYKKILQVGITSFMLFLAGCGPITLPQNIDSVSASSILSNDEASCNGQVPQDVSEARKNDASFLVENGASIEEVKLLMESFCAGLISP